MNRFLILLGDLFIAVMGVCEKIGNVFRSPQKEFENKFVLELIEQTDEHNVIWLNQDVRTAPSYVTARTNAGAFYCSYKNRHVRMAVIKQGFSDAHRCVVYIDDGIVLNVPERIVEKLYKAIIKYTERINDMSIDEQVDFFNKHKNA